MNKQTYHCGGCPNTSAKIADRVDEKCCTCCRDKDGNRPGQAAGTW